MTWLYTQDTAARVYCLVKFLCMVIRQSRMVLLTKIHAMLLAKNGRIASHELFMIGRKADGY